MTSPIRSKRKIDLGLMLAHTCNITCRHCGILSSPHNKNRMPLDTALDYIRQAGRLRPLVRSMAFTGGEPFLFIDEHLEMIELCRSLGLGARVVTNGFWARDVEKGKDLLSRFRDAGLTEINISADKWHLEFLPAEVFRNAIECVHAIGYVAVVSFAHNTSGDPLEEFSRLYGYPRERVRQLDLNELRTMLRDSKSHPCLRRDLFLAGGQIIGLGRAAEYPEELIMAGPLEFQSGGCPEVNNKPVIYPDGDLLACCCAGGKMEAFVVGNLADAPLDNLLERMLSRTQFQFINRFGPRQVYDAVAEARPDISRPERFSSICEMCVRANDGLCAEEMDHILSGKTLEYLLAGTDFKAATAAGP